MTEHLFRDDAYLKTCEAKVTKVDEHGIQLDRTVFYPMGGGQAGDSGRLLLGDGRVVAISDTAKGAAPTDVLHIPAEGTELPSVGDSVTAEIDWERRYRLMRMHTCLHLLSAIVPFPVTGGSISDGKGRLDFDIPEASLDKEQISMELKRLVSENHVVSDRWISDEELAASPDLVKTMSVTPPKGQGQVRLIEVDGQDLQACGGTHVARTGEIGAVRVRKIEKKGRQNRRVSVVFED